MSSDVVVPSGIRCRSGTRGAARQKHGLRRETTSRPSTAAVDCRRIMRDDWRSLVHAIEDVRSPVATTRGTDAPLLGATLPDGAFGRRRADLARALTRESARDAVPEWVIRYARRVLRWHL